MKYVVLSLPFDFKYIQRSLQKKPAARGSNVHLSDKSVKKNQDVYLAQKYQHIKNQVHF